MADARRQTALWQQVRRLAQCCTVTIETDKAAPRWRVTVIQQRHLAAPLVHVADDLVDAVAGAVARAEEVGWSTSPDPD